MKKPGKDATPAELRAYARWVRAQLDVSAPRYSEKEHRRAAHLHDRYYRIEEAHGRPCADAWIERVAEEAAKPQGGGRAED